MVKPVIVTVDDDPAVLNAVRAYATIGEISDVFREVLGVWQPDMTF